MPALHRLNAFKKTPPNASLPLNFGAVTVGQSRIGHGMAVITVRLDLPCDTGWAREHYVCEYVSV